MKIVGHRGARGLAPENTLVSFKKALQYKVDAVEVDARVTKDKVAVVHHASEVIDASSNKLAIAETNCAELKSHKPDLVTLEEALKTINKTVPVYIEVKSGVPVPPIVKVIEEFKLTPRDCLLGSFSLPLLEELHRALPQIPIFVNERWSGVRATRRARKLDTKIININSWVLWPGFIKVMRSNGYELYTYTLNDPKKAHRWAKYGLAGVFTDFPDRFAPRD